MSARWLDYVFLSLIVWVAVFLSLSTGHTKERRSSDRNSTMYTSSRRDEIIPVGQTGKPVGKDFFGIENVPYRRLDVLRKTLPLISSIGVGLLGRNTLDWGDIEPAQPKGNVHHYNWTNLDREFQIYHQYGFSLQTVIRLRSPWATIVPSTELKHDAAGSPAKEIYRDDWGAFIYELVERYDGDGYRDAFKMNRPLLRILSIQGEIEFPGHWSRYGGTPENYTRMLEIAKDAAHRAAPEILVARAGVSFGNFFDIDPKRPRDLKKTKPARKLSDRIAKSRRGSAVYSFLQHSFKNPESYDLFGIHANADYSGILPFTTWLRSEMSRYGPPKRIFIEDASSLLGGSGKRAAGSEREQYVRGLYQEAERDKSHGSRELQRFQAEQAIKKATMALVADVHSILFIGYLDLPKAKYLGFRHGGFIDSNILLGTGDPNQSAKRVCHVLKEFIKIVVGGTNFRVEDFGEEIWTVSFLKGNIPHYIVWKEGHPILSRLQVTGTATELIRLPFGDNNIQSTKEYLSVDSGKISITLDRYPIILRGSQIKRGY